MTRTLLSTLIAASAFAAAPLTAQSSFGLVGGIVSSNITISGGGASVSYNTRTGFAAGVSMAGPISQGLEFAPELLYIQKGSQINNGSSSVGLKVSYVELPLLFRVKFGSSSTRAFVLAGPAIGVKASCKLTASSGGTSGSEDCDNSDEGLKSVDFGLMFGAGIAHNRLSASVRYDLGLANTLKSTTSGLSYKNRVWLAMVGITL